MQYRTEEPILEMKNISKSYGTLKALKKIDLAIYKNECIGLVGDNGAGKSTLIKILSGICIPDSGLIYSNSKKVRLNSYRDATNIGIETIYQDAAVVNQMDAARNIFLGREIKYPLGFLNTKKMEKITMDILGSIGIRGINSPRKLVGKLSGGQKQSVAIARAVYFKSKILLLDEPTSALSVKETRFVHDFIIRIKNEGVSSIYVSHNIHLAYMVVDRFVVLSHGEKVGEFLKKDITAEEISDIIIAH